MFIITKDFAVELKDICKMSRYKDDDVSTANSIYKSIIQGCKNGASEQDYKDADEAYEEYLSTCKQYHQLEINNSYTLLCVSEDAMNSIYDKVIQALKMLHVYVEISGEDGAIE